MFLKGTRIVELSAGLSGAYAARILADLGAEVIKIEPPEGDEVRAMGPASSAVPDGALFAYLNFGKRSVTLDLSTEAGRHELHELLAGSQLLIEGGQDPIGSLIDLEAVRTRNSALGVVSVTAYGRHATQAFAANSPLTLQHRSGFAYHQSRPVADPLVQPPVGGADREGPLGIGVAVAVAALNALLGGAIAGTGRDIDIAGFDFYFQLMFDEVAEWHHGERSYDRFRKGARGAEVAGGLIWILPCIDGWVMVSPRQQHQWDRWIELIGSPEWATDMELCGAAPIRKKRWAELQQLMTPWTLNLPKNEVFRLSQEAKVPCFPISEPQDLLANEQLLHRQFFHRLTLAPDVVIPVPGVPFRAVGIDGADLIGRGRDVHSPALGEANGIGNPAAAAKPEMAPPRKTADAKTDLPLAGLRVLDFSWVVAGPMATKMLAAMGAEVIRVESTLRSEYTNRSGYFHVLNPGKRSCSINISTEQGRALVRRLVGLSDVVIENFSTPVLKKYELSYQHMSKVRPDLIFCSASGVGRTGPQSDVLAYGTLLQGYSGRTRLIGPTNPHLEAMGIRPAWTDPVTAMWETAAVLAAVHHRRKTGAGAFIDLSMLESTVALLSDSLLGAALGSNDVPPGGNDEPDASPGGCFHGIEGDDWVAVAVRSDAEWQAFCTLLGHPEWLASDLFRTTAARRQNKAWLNQQLTEWVAQRSCDAAEAALQAAGIAAARSRGFADLMSDSLVDARGLLPTLSDGTRTISLPWMEKNGWRGSFTPPPVLGGDNQYVFAELLGLPQDKIDRLVAAEVIR